MPLLWLSLAFLTGILLAQKFSLPVLAFVGLAVLALLMILPIFHRRIVGYLPSLYNRINLSNRLTPATFYPLLIFFLAMGGLRYQLAQPRLNPSFIAYYNDQSSELSLEGVIVDLPDVRDSYTNLRIKTEQITDPMQASATGLMARVHGSLLARVSMSEPIAYGDRIRLQGHLVTPPENEDFSYRDYLANHGIYSFIAYPVVTVLAHGHGNPFYASLYALRQHAINLVYSLYPDPESSLVAGILLGVQSGIPPDVQEAFRLTGTSHIIVISGFNITIIALVFTFLFSYILGKRRGAIVAAIGIIAYTIFVGANPAVLRAAFLGLLTLLGHQLGRRQSGLNSLAFAAAFLALITPTILWDISFQLSFAATLGIILYADPLSRSFSSLAERTTSQTIARRMAGPVSAYFLLTLAAQLTTLPLMAFYFKRISLTSLVANPLILPVQPLLMVLGGLSVLTGLVLHPLGQLLAWATWPFVSYTIRIVEWLSAVPHGSVPLGQVALPLILAFYVVLFAITFFHTRFMPLVKRLTPVIPLAALGVVTVFAWKAAFYAPDNLLHVTVLDVGTGDAVLIRSPSGRYALVNGGSSTISLSDRLGRRLPLFNRALDWLVVADIDNEDLAGIPGNLERFKPINVLWAGNTSGTRSATQLQETIASSSIPVSMMHSGQFLDLGSGASLKFLYTNQRGAVLLLEWNDFRMLLPMGMDFGILETLQNDSTMRNISAVLLAESGYAPLNPPELISYLNPQLALLSVASADKTGLPSLETTQVLEGYNLLRTDQNGWIELTTDSKQMWVQVEKK
ncbi:MAG: DUF4131 domain-containing protein [Anaerolineae bacterium]|nr:DUF4131 domain-containing protein [Anaerolineae bacterium]